MMEARAGVEPTYTDLQRINGHNLPYKSIGYVAINCCVTICAIDFEEKCYLSNDFCRFSIRYLRTLLPNSKKSVPSPIFTFEREPVNFLESEKRSQSSSISASPVSKFWAFSISQNS